MQDFVSFQYMGYGTNMQWVYCVQTEEGKLLHAEVPQYFTGVIFGVNLEMMERPELLEPPVVAGEWEETSHLFVEPQQDCEESENPVNGAIREARAAGAAGTIRVLGNFEGGNRGRNRWVCVQPTPCEINTSKPKSNPESRWQKPPT